MDALQLTMTIEPEANPSLTEDDLYRKGKTICEMREYLRM